LGGLAQITNARLDQLLMITAVAPRELGLYAVATTISTLPTVVTGAVSSPLMTRVGSGERFLVPRAVRMTVLLTVALGGLVALATPTMLSLLFGSHFQAAVPMAMVLLAASVPLAGANVLSTGLQADGAPLIGTAAEAIAVVVTVVGLLTLLGPLQGMGAAIVSLAAYSSSFLFQLAKASRRLGARVSEFVVPRPADCRWITQRARDAMPRFGTAQ
jgi:O-antigen/teichoic acid export membrane protein